MPSHKIMNVWNNLPDIIRSSLKGYRLVNKFGVCRLLLVTIINYPRAKTPLYLFFVSTVIIEFMNVHWAVNEKLFKTNEQKHIITNFSIFFKKQMTVMQ